MNSCIVGVCDSHRHRPPDAEFTEPFRTTTMESSRFNSERMSRYGPRHSHDQALNRYLIVRAEVNFDDRLKFVRREKVRLRGRRPPTNRQRVECVPVRGLREELKTGRDNTPPVTLFETTPCMIKNGCRKEGREVQNVFRLYGELRVVVTVDGVFRTLRRKAHLLRTTFGVLRAPHQLIDEEDETRGIASSRPQGGSPA